MPALLRLLRQPIAVILCSAIAHSAELPVKNIVLYKHGIGYFERTGKVGAGEEARLDFKNADMNDVLKSLTVTDRTGSRVSGIRYDSNATLEQQLQDFPFHIDAGEKLSTFLDRFRGARLELKAPEGAQAGSLVSAHALTSGSGPNPPVLEQVTLLLDSGELVNYDLARVSSLRLTDVELQQQLKQYLSIVAKSKARDKRSVYIDSVGNGARDLQVSYIAPVAIWKSSYRLTLADKSRLEGWAIVDNTTDEDWSNVTLSVVSGRPISFISLLDRPRFGNRQIADLPEDRAAGPEVYGGSVNGRVGGVIGGVAGGVGGGVFRAKAVPPQAAPAPDAAQSVQLQAESTIQAASGATLGELFEYNFQTPVTIKRNQSAMLPFIQDQIGARKLLIYKPDDGEHPVNAAEVTNTSGKTLDGGPITVYDAGAYAGEALVETFKAGDKRLIGYAVDYGTRITTNFESGSQSVLEVHGNNGALEVKSAQHATKTYEMKNVDAKAKTLIIQQEAEDEYNIVSPRPSERTSNAYRFEVQIPANGAQTLKVEQEKVISETTMVTSATPDFLVDVLSGKKLSDAGRAQLQQITASKRKIVETQSAINVNKTASDELTQDQARLRQNIDSLNRVSGQEDKVRQYSTRLNDNEVKLAEFRDKREGLVQNLSSLNAQLLDSIAKLQF